MSAIVALPPPHQLAFTIDGKTAIHPAPAKVGWVARASLRVPRARPVLDRTNTGQQSRKPFQHASAGWHWACRQCCVQSTARIASPRCLNEFGVNVAPRIRAATKSRYRECWLGNSLAAPRLFVRSRPIGRITKTHHILSLRSTAKAVLNQIMYTITHTTCASYNRQTPRDRPAAALSQFGCQLLMTRGQRPRSRYKDNSRKPLLVLLTLC